MPYVPPGGGGGSGTVTSVALTAPAEFAVAGSPVTTTGTLAITKANQNANIIYAGPSSGGAAAPTFRALVLADLPANIAAATAATLATPRAINGVNFDGSAAITVAAAAGTLTGATLAANVLASSLTSVGVLASPHMTSPTVDSGNLTYSAAANVVVVANTASALQFTDGTNAYHAIDTRTTVSGVVAHSLSATGPTIASASGVTYSVVSIPAVTTTLTGSVLVTALNGLALNVARPTVTDASAQTTTTLSTVYIAGAPILAGSAVGTTALALHVAQGTSRFDGNVNLTTNILQFSPTGEANSLRRSAVNTLVIQTGGSDAWIISTSLTTIIDANNIAVGSTTGTKIGTATTQKLGFYNVSPIAQRSGAAQALVATTASTQTTPFGYSTSAQADAIVTLVNELRNWAVAQGFIAGA